MGLDKDLCKTASVLKSLGTGLCSVLQAMCLFCWKCKEREGCGHSVIWQFFQLNLHWGKRLPCEAIAWRLSAFLGPHFLLFCVSLAKASTPSTSLAILMTSHACFFWSGFHFGQCLSDKTALCHYGLFSFSAPVPLEFSTQTSLLCHPSSSPPLIRNHWLSYFSFFTFGNIRFLSHLVFRPAYHPQPFWRVAISQSLPWFSCKASSILLMYFCKGLLVV